MKNKAIFKFNSGNLALLCSDCREIIKIGSQFSSKELLACSNKLDLQPQYCQQCQKNK